MSRSQDHIPTVSVGLPVFNGERYLDQAIRSIVDQTFIDWELIIADNASNDTTQEIAEGWVGRDDRIRYVRHPQNLGAARNFNLALESARGKYLKWLAHDDVCGSRFLEVCVAALESDPSIALAYPTPTDIDAEGAIIGPRDVGLNFAQTRPAARFAAVTSQGHACLAMFGVFRRYLFDRGVRHGAYEAADRVLLAEIALYGRMVEVDEKQYFHREHEERYSQALKRADAETRDHWFTADASRQRTYPHWARLGGYLRAVAEANLPLREQVGCYVHVAKWSVAMSRSLASDLVRR